MTDPHFILVHTDTVNERHYFVRTGEHHHSAKLGLIRLIAETSTDIKKAVRFDTAPEAAKVLVEAGNPSDWGIEPV